MLNIFFVLGRGGGHMVSVLAFYSVDQSSNPAESTVFIMSSCLKINETETGIGHLFFFFGKDSRTKNLRFPPEIVVRRFTGHIRTVKRSVC